MAEYIEREAVINHLRECDGTPHEIAYTYPVYKDLEQFVESLPAADVAPVARGRWVKHSVDGTDMFGEPTEIVFACNCSVCGLDGRSETPYCPNCGAKMEESESK